MSKKHMKIITRSLTCSCNCNRTFVQLLQSQMMRTQQHPTFTKNLNNTLDIVYAKFIQHIQSIRKAKFHLEGTFNFNDNKQTIPKCLKSRHYLLYAIIHVSNHLSSSACLLKHLKSADWYSRHQSMVLGNPVYVSTSTNGAMYIVPKWH